MPDFDSVSYRYITYFDASAAVKLIVPEPGSDNVRAHFNEHARFYMTSLCFAEALGVLKRKMLRNQLTREAYFDACFELMVYLDRGRIHLDDTPGGGLEIFLKAEAIAKKHKLDLSDAFQIISVKHGKEFIAAAAQESKTVIATADLELETAAEKEGLRVWNCEKSPRPPECLTS